MIGRLISGPNTYGGSFDEEGHSVVETTDGGYVVGGLYSQSFGDKDFYLFKTDNVGILLWEKAYGGTKSDLANSMVLTSDGGFALTGQTYSFVPGLGYSSYVVKTDADGNSCGGTNLKPTSTVVNNYVLAAPGSVVSTASTISSANSTYTTTSVSSSTGLCVVLPIELLSFNGTNEGGENKLYWTTASEINNDYFIVERDKEQEVGEWEETGKVKGAGNSNQKLNYSFVDEHSFVGVNYYRLKQTDFDGNFSYSKTISISNQHINQSIINIYPIPSYQELSYEFYSEENSLTNISVINLLGNTVIQKHIKVTQGINKSKINIEKLSEGMYFLKAGNTQTKFIKK